MQMKKCFIDGDSIIYRLALKDITLEQAQKYYGNIIKQIGRDCSTSVALKGDGNFRYEIDADYKGKRKGAKDPIFKERRQALTEYAYSLGHFKSDNCEADDVVSIWAQEAIDAKEDYVIAHIDKDIDMVEGWHYNYNKKTLYHVSELQGYYNMCIQMLTGDSTDNIKGIVGIGPKKAEKLLEDKDQMLDKVQEAWQTAHPEDWEKRLETCWNLLYMRRTWDGFKRLNLEDTIREKLESSEKSNGLDTLPESCYNAPELNESPTDYEKDELL